MDKDKLLSKLLKDHRENGHTLIYLLEKIQDGFGYIPENVVYWFSDKLDIPASKFYRIITFYPKFRLKPTGKNTVTVCCGAACHIKGGDRVMEKIRETLSLKEDEDTTSNLLFTVQQATCIGACSIAPIVILNDQVYGNSDSEKVVKLLKGFEKEDEFIGYI